MNRASLQFSIGTLLIACLGVAVAAKELALSVEIHEPLTTAIPRAGLWGSEILLTLHVLGMYRGGAVRTGANAWDMANLVRGVLVSYTSLYCHLLGYAIRFGGRSLTTADQYVWRIDVCMVLATSSILAILAGRWVGLPVRPRCWSQYMGLATTVLWLGFSMLRPMICGNGP